MFVDTVILWTSYKKMKVMALKGKHPVRLKTATDVATSVTFSLS